MSYRRTAQVALSVIFVILACADLMGERVSGIVYGGANVSVNGNPVSASTAVFPGDAVRTGSNPAKLVSSGLLIDVEPNSSLLFGKPLQLVNGSMVVSGSNPFTVRVGEQTVESSAPATTLKVINRQGVGIAVLDGSATLRQGNKRTFLGKGQSSGRVSPDKGKRKPPPPPPPRRRPSPWEP